jgi:pyruvate kinase
VRLLQVSLAQKWMTAKANLKGKPCIVSAQIMYSMVDRWVREERALHLVTRRGQALGCLKTGRP